MAAFDYVALDNRGRERKGVLEGDTPRQVRSLLRERGLTPLEVTTAHRQTDRDSPRAGPRVGLGKGLSSTDLALVTRQLATLVHSGLTVEEALQGVVQQAEKGRIKGIILPVRARVMEGHSLAKALKDFPRAFPELYRATVGAGEQSGHLDTVLERLADYTETRQQMRQKVGLALFYPALLTLMAVLVVIGLLTYVVPEVVEVFTSIDQELPWLTRALIATSDFFKAYGPFVLIGLIAAFVTFLRLLRWERFRVTYHRLLLRIPLIQRLVRGGNTARFARTLSILTAAGVPVLEAFRIAAEVISNLPMQRAVEEAAVRVREGSTINRALGRSQLFPPMTVQLIASGESSGNLETMLERAAEHQERELETLIGAILALFEPLLILVMGGIVLLIVIAILLPIFELNQLVGA